MNKNKKSLCSRVEMTEEQILARLLGENKEKREKLQALENLPKGKLSEERQRQRGCTYQKHPRLKDTYILTQDITRYENQGYNYNLSFSEGGNYHEGAY